VIARMVGPAPLKKAPCAKKIEIANEQTPRKGEGERGGEK